MMRHPHRAAGAAAVLALLALTGCDSVDPLKRPYMWHPTDTNRHNIAAQAANPADLLRGRDAPRRRAAMDSDSVDRLWTGRLAPLPTDSPGAASGGTTATTGGGSSSGGGT